jgi:hypothetical protein
MLKKLKKVTVEKKAKKKLKTKKRDAWYINHPPCG